MKTKSFRRLENLLSLAESNGIGLAVHLSTADECCWACELRYTEKPNNPAGPDESVVFYAGGGADADAVLGECLDALNANLS